MEWTEILTQIFEMLIIPLLGVGVTYLTIWLKKKAAELEVKINNEKLSKYTNMLTDTIIDCVLATKQTYVDSLKGKNLFTVEAQANAFNTTKDAVLAILTDDAKECLTDAYGDLNALIESKIEATVQNTK